MYIRIEGIKTLKEHANRVRSVAFSSRSSALLATGSDDKTAKIWNVETGECIKTLVGNTHYVYSVAFSTANPNLLVTGSMDTTARAWTIPGIYDPFWSTRLHCTPHAVPATSQRFVHFLVLVGEAMCREVGGASAGTNAGTDRDAWAVAGGRSPNAAENGVSAGAGAVFAAATAASIDAAVPSVSVALATVAAVWHWATLINSNAHGQMVTPAEPILALAVGTRIHSSSSSSNCSGGSDVSGGRGGSLSLGNCRCAARQPLLPPEIWLHILSFLRMSELRGVSIVDVSLPTPAINGRNRNRNSNRSPSLRRYLWGWWGGGT